MSQASGARVACAGPRVLPSDLVTPGFRHTLTLLAALSLGGTGCATRLHDAAARDGGSRGRPSGGWLAGGTTLPDRGYGYTTFRGAAEGGYLLGTTRLVGMVVRAARSLVARDQASLRVGDLSAPRGGRVQRHHSHRNGRDVDLLFFVRDAATDRPVMSEGFVRFNRQGESVGASVPLRFDTARNWQLLEALLRDDEAAVLRVFCAAWLRRMLLDYGQSAGRPAWVLERAEQVLLQPGDSLPHDDHFHVRVACTPGERVRGCVDGAPLWPWLRHRWEKDDAPEALDDEALLALLEPLPPGLFHGPPEAPPGELAEAEGSEAVRAAMAPATSGLLCGGAGVRWVSTPAAYVPAAVEVCR